MKSKRALDFIATMRQHGIKEAVAREILSLWDDREGELATKADLDQVEKRLEASIDQLRMASRHDIERLEASQQQLREGQKRLEEGQNEQRKANRWAIGIIVAAIIGGFTLQGMYIIAQISDLKADYRQTQPADQQPTDQTSASGRL